MPVPSKLSGKTSGYQWPSLPESEKAAIMDMLPPPPPPPVGKKGSGISGVRSTTSRKKMNVSRLSSVDTPTALPTGERRASSSSSGGKRPSLKQEPPSTELTLAKLLAEKLVSSKWTGVHEVVINTRDETIQVCMSEVFFGTCVQYVFSPAYLIPVLVDFDVVLGVRSKPLM